MEGYTELLSTIVEFSVGLAGFSGVIGIFIHRSGHWAHVDRFRITNLLVMSLTPGFLAFFTLGLLQVAQADIAVRISSGVYTLTLFSLLIFLPRDRARVPDQDKHLVGSHIFFPMAGTFAAIMVTQALVTISVLDRHTFTIYYYSLVVMLLLAVVQFIRLIVARPSEGVGSDDDA